MNLDFLVQKAEGQFAKYRNDDRASIKACLIAIGVATYDERKAGNDRIKQALAQSADIILTALLQSAIEGDKIGKEFLALLDAVENEDDPWLKDVGLGMIEMQMMGMGINFVRNMIKERAASNGQG